MIPSCKQVTRLVSDDLERPLTFWERVGLRSHLLVCSACRAYRRQVRGLSTLFRNRQKKEPIPSGETGLSPEAKQRIARHIRGHFSK